MSESTFEPMAAAAGHAQIRLHAVDGLRGVAALMVAVYHFQVLFSTRPLLDGGWIAVSLFFLLSGIVMLHVYETKILRGEIKFSVFLAHRIARLWPLHLFAMLTVMAVELVHAHFSNWPSPLNWNGAVYTFFLNAFLLQNVGVFSGPVGGASWDGNGWSLSPEILLNLVWFHLLVKGRLSSALLAASILVSAIVQFNFGGAVIQQS